MRSSDTQRNPVAALPGWALDALLALLLVAAGIVLERITQGRVANESIALFVGLGSFGLLRLGALFGAVGRTVGCLFVFALTWVLPCAGFIYMTTDRTMQRVVRDSVPLFLYLGLVLIIIMLVTFERMRLADVTRYHQGQHPADEVADS